MFGGKRAPALGQEAKLKSDFSVLCDFEQITGLPGLQQLLF
jgi:hypothetical protein